MMIAADAETMREAAVVAAAAAVAAAGEAGGGTGTGGGEAVYVEGDTLEFLRRNPVFKHVLIHRDTTRAEHGRMKFKCKRCGHFLSGSTTRVWAHLRGEKGKGCLMPCSSPISEQEAEMQVKRRTKKRKLEEEEGQGISNGSSSGGGNGGFTAVDDGEGIVAAAVTAVAALAREAKPEGKELVDRIVLQALIANGCDLHLVEDEFFCRMLAAVSGYQPPSIEEIHEALIGENGLAKDIWDYYNEHFSIYYGSGLALDTKSNSVAFTILSPTGNIFLGSKNASTLKSPSQTEGAIWEQLMDVNSQNPLRKEIRDSVFYIVFDRVSLCRETSKNLSNEFFCFWSLSHALSHLLAEIVALKTLNGIIEEIREVVDVFTNWGILKTKFKTLSKATLDPLIPHNFTSLYVSIDKVLKYYAQLQQVINDPDFMKWSGLNEEKQTITAKVRGLIQSRLFKQKISWAHSLMKPILWFLHLAESPVPLSGWVKLGWEKIRLHLTNCFKRVQDDSGDGWLSKQAIFETSRFVQFKNESSKDEKLVMGFVDAIEVLHHSSIWTMAQVVNPLLRETMMQKRKSGEIQPLMNDCGTVIEWFIHRFGLETTVADVLNELDNYLTGEVPYTMTALSGESILKYGESISEIWAVIPLSEGKYFLPTISQKVLSITCDTGAMERILSAPGDTQKQKSDIADVALFCKVGLRFMQQQGFFNSNSNSSSSSSQEKDSARGPNPAQFFQWFDKTLDSSSSSVQEENNSLPSSSPREEKLYRNWEEVRKYIVESRCPAKGLPPIANTSEQELNQFASRLDGVEQEM